MTKSTPATRAEVHAVLDNTEPPAWLRTVPGDVLHRGPALLAWLDDAGLPRPTLFDLEAARRRRHVDNPNRRTRKAA